MTTNETLIEEMSKEQCPTCGFYCLGKGGFGCIDKPAILKGKCRCYGIKREHGKKFCPLHRYTVNPKECLHSKLSIDDMDKQGKKRCLGCGIYKLPYPEVVGKLQGVNWWGHLMNANDKPTLDDDGDWSSYAKCSKCGAVENTDESIKVCPKAEYIHISVLRSAIQAKQHDMVEKFKEMIGQDEQEVNLREDMAFEKNNRVYERNELRFELRSKLSNLSEK